MTRSFLFGKSRGSGASGDASSSAFFAAKSYGGILELWSVVMSVMLPSRWIVKRIVTTPGMPLRISIGMFAYQWTRIFATIEAEAKRIGEATGTTFAFADSHESVAAPSDPRVRQMIADAAKAHGYSSRVMPSGAGHDAQAMAQLGPMGMIFIPSIGGISHSPREFSTTEDIARGANVLMATLLLADKQ